MTISDFNTMHWCVIQLTISLFPRKRESTEGGLGRRLTSETGSEEGYKEMTEAAFRPESATDAPVPIGLFNLDSMDTNRQFSMLSLVKHWGLECHQKTPDIPAIEQLLASRYGYWDEDVPHDGPFPGSSAMESKGGLVVVRDIPPQHQA